MMLKNSKQSDVLSNKLFANIKKQKVKIDKSDKNYKQFKEGDVVYTKGEKSKYFYLVVEGKVKIKIPNPPFAAKIVTRGINEFFGERELLQNKKRLSSVVAEKDTTLFLLSKSELIKMMNDYKEVKENIEMDSITTDGKTLNDLTVDSTKADEEVIDYSSAIKIHPDEPINKSNLTKNKKTTFELDDLIIKDNVTEEAIKTEENYPKIETKEIFKKTEDITKEETEEPTKEVIDGSLKKVRLKEEFKKLELEKKKLAKEKEILKKEREKIEKLKTQKINTVEETKNLDNFDVNDYEKIIKCVREIQSKQKLEDIEKVIRNNSIKLFNAEKAIIYFVNQHKKILEAKIEINGKINELKMSLNSGIAGACLTENDLIVVKDVSKEKRFNFLYDEANNFKTKNLIAIPLKGSKGENAAVLEIFNSKEGNYSDKNIKILRLMSEVFTLSLFNSFNKQKSLKANNDIIFKNVSKFIFNESKNPLLTIKHYGNLLLRDEIPEEIKQVLQLIITQSEFIDSLNNSLVKYTEDEVISSLQEVSFKETFNHILQILAEFAESRNCILLKKNDVEGKVKLDVKYFVIACYQIIKNACDAYKEKGEIFISTKISDDKILIDIKDNASGISKERQEKIFQPFTSFKEGIHLGLGLPIADKIIKEHGGNLLLSSNIEEGSNFTIVLPILKKF